MANSTIKVIVHNSGTIKDSIIGCGYINIKDLLDQNRGMIVLLVIILISLIISIVNIKYIGDIQLWKFYTYVICHNHSIDL